MFNTVSPQNLEKILQVHEFARIWSLLCMGAGGMTLRDIKKPFSKQRDL